MCGDKSMTKISKYTSAWVSWVNIFRIIPEFRILWLTFHRKLGPKKSGFIRIREMSGKFKFFQGQGIVREFYVVSVKNGYLLKCQGNVREFYNFQFLSNDEKQKIARQFS